MKALLTLITISVSFYSNAHAGLLSSGSKQAARVATHSATLKKTEEFMAKLIRAKSQSRIEVKRLDLPQSIMKFEEKVYMQDGNIVRVFVNSYRDITLPSGVRTEISLVVHSNEGTGKEIYKNFSRAADARLVSSQHGPAIRLSIEDSTSPAITDLAQVITKINQGTIGGKSNYSRKILAETSR